MKPITSVELRDLYQAFFETKGHVRIPSAPLVPEHDPSVLFTTAGMHPLVPYLKGQAHPAGKRLVDAQKCLRTTDIDSVGDATHATVFEMLGNWSLGDYFKHEAITWSWEFLTGKEWLGINPNYLAVSVFHEDKDSAQIWQKLGVPEARMAHLGVDDNWWPSGGTQPGPQGPDTEMFYWTSPVSAGQPEPPRVFDPRDSGWVEIWNDVFMQFNRTPDGKLEELPQKNVDTGMGLERTVMILNGLTSIYEIDSFQPLMQLIDEAANNDDIRHKRILADQIKAATFILGDEHPVEPSNTDRGYVLRRVIRRAVRSARQLGIQDIGQLLAAGQAEMTRQYGDHYPSLVHNQAAAAERLKNEVAKFEAVLSEGLRRFQAAATGKLKGEVLPGEAAFKLYESHGFPIELTQEMAQEQGLAVDMGGFEEALKAHQERSREGAKQKFVGGLADHSEMSVKYHTATHLLHRALQDVLGKRAVQRGSNITAERLRFDFSHPDKMMAEQTAKVEEIVNEKIQANLLVKRLEMTVQEAREKGALGLFGHKYAEKVSVYEVGDYSIEICGGPHVERTGVLGKFKITKEESAGAGIRRIKAILA